MPRCPECDRLVHAEKLADKLADKQFDLSGATDERVRLRMYLDAVHGVPSVPGTPNAEGRDA